jgi:hypothetical protein
MHVDSVAFEVLVIAGAVALYPIQGRILLGDSEDFEQVELPLRTISTFEDFDADEEYQVEISEFTSFKYVTIILKTVEKLIRRFPTDMPACSVCMELYNATTRNPCILNGCGHTFCQLCLETIKGEDDGDGDLRCPLCKASWTTFHSNIALKEWLPKKRPFNID